MCWVSSGDDSNSKHCGQDARAPIHLAMNRTQDKAVSVGTRASCPQGEGALPAHKHWHSRGYLPHCDTPNLLQFITFHLADSLPADVLNRLLRETDEIKKHQQFEHFWDTGYGACWLQQDAIADIVEDALLFGDGARYRLLAWCVMPNHLHVLIETNEQHLLSEVVHMWKSFTAKAINHHLARTGSVWMPDYFDRYIRDDNHLAAVIAYIHQNPVSAGLVQDATQWRHSSAAGSAGILPASAVNKPSGQDARAST